MSTQRKRLQLHRETLRTLNPDELDHVHGGVLIPHSRFICNTNQTHPISEPPPPPEETPPDGIPVFPPIQFPRDKARPSPGTQPGRSHNGFCTGL